MSTFEPEPSQPGENPNPAGSAASSSLPDISIAGWGVFGATLLTFVVSFFPWYSASISAGGYSASASANAWHRFWWLPILVALAAGVVYGLTLFKIIPAQPKTALILPYGGILAFVLTILALVDTLTHSDSGTGWSSGPSVGVFLGLVTTAALAYFGALSAQESGATLPITVPGPRR